jgi:hypothetical protein
MPRFLPAWVTVCLFASQTLCPAQGFVEHLSPPVLERGKTTRVTVVGTQLHNAVGWWTSLAPAGVQARPIESREDHAVFEVRVAENAPVGLFGLRVATVDGLSNVHLCLIDDLPVRPAPDSLKAPAKVELPCALWGPFREARVDRFAVEVTAGQKISFEVVGNRFGKDVDPLLTIRDDRGRIVAERDNDPGLYFDCRFEHTFAVAGIHTVEVRDARFTGHEHGYYVLRMGRYPAARVAVPPAARPGQRVDLFLPEIGQAVPIDIPADCHLGPRSLSLRRRGDEGSTWLPLEMDTGEITVAAMDSVTPEKATPAKVPGQLGGVLTRPGERHFFRLQLDKGQTIHVVGHARWLNSPVDPEVTLTDATGKVLRPATEGPDETVTLDFTAPAPGTWCLAIRDLARDGGPAYTYRLDVRTGPRPDVVAEVEGLTVPRDGYQIVPLTVARNGYSGAITLQLDGAPSGVTLLPTEIPAGANTVVCRLAATGATPLGLHTVQVLARTADASAPWQPVRTHPLIDRQMLNKDLIPYTLREDQRRVPPSLSDRLALFVTEPAPFTVELAETSVTLPRYQHAEIPLALTRRPGFDAPITFTARGGQLADKNEGRTRVYTEFPMAGPRDEKVSGSVHSRILSNLGKTRIEVLATTMCDGRQVTLIRTFELEIRPAFRITAESSTPVKVEPGKVVKVRLNADRVKSFAGPVKVALSAQQGLELPEMATIPSGQDGVEIVVKVQADAPPGRRSIVLSATGDVDGFEEEERNGRLEVEVVKPEPKR